MATGPQNRCGSTPYPNLPVQGSSAWPSRFGGGWINSPARAYRADPTMMGRANFGFASKYKKGRRRRARPSSSSREPQLPQRSVRVARRGGGQSAGQRDRQRGPADGLWFLLTAHEG